MKKLVLSLAILGFITFGALSVQNLIASSAQTEIVNFDKDPKKEDTKKAADTKDAKADVKSSESCAKSCASSCASSCSDKSASAKSCCTGEKASTAKADSPDVK